MLIFSSKLLATRTKNSQCKDDSWRLNSLDIAKAYLRTTLACTSAGVEPACALWHSLRILA
eukprot:3742616-Alexandrium_andersonii.AAC.1